MIFVSKPFWSLTISNMHWFISMNFSMKKSPNVTLGYHQPTHLTQPTQLSQPTNFQSFKFTVIIVFFVCYPTLWPYQILVHFERYSCWTKIISWWLSSHLNNTFLLPTNNQCIEIHQRLTSNRFTVYSRQHMISLNAMTMPKQLPRVGGSNGSRTVVRDADTTAVVEYYVDPFFSEIIPWFSQVHELYNVSRRMKCTVVIVTSNRFNRSLLYYRPWKS